MSRATATGFCRASENSISPKGVLCGVTSCAGVDRREHSDGPAMCVMMFLASNRTPTEFTCTPSVIRWSVLMFLLSMNPHWLRVVIDFNSSLESSTCLRSDSDWYFRCMMDETVTGVGWRVSPREVICAAIVSGSSEVLFVPTCTITSERLCFNAVSLALWSTIREIPRQILLRPDVSTAHNPPRCARWIHARRVVSSAELQQSLRKNPSRSNDRRNGEQEHADARGDQGVQFETRGCEQILLDRRVGPCTWERWETWYAKAIPNCLIRICRVEWQGNMKQISSPWDQSAGKQLCESTISCWVVHC